jgi:N-formylglutamate amidohydrolase
VNIRRADILAGVTDTDAVAIQINGDSAVVLHVPHAGTGVPDGIRVPDIGDLDDEIFLMADLYTDRIAGMVSQFLVRGGANKPSEFRNLLSRLIMDPERFDDDSEEMNAIGMGVVYSKTHDGRDLYTPPLPADEIEDRKARWYRTYAAAFTELVDTVLTRHGRCLILDIHSYARDALAYELHQTDDRPPICIGVDPYHDPGAHTIADVLNDHGFRTNINQPFSGSYVPLKHWHQDPRVTSVMLEIRKDQYLIDQHFDDDLGRTLPEAIADAVERSGH